MSTTTDKKSPQTTSTSLPSVSAPTPVSSSSSASAATPSASTSTSTSPPSNSASLPPTSAPTSALPTPTSAPIVTSSVSPTPPASVSIGTSTTSTRSSSGDDVTASSTGTGGSSMIGTGTAKGLPTTSTSTAGPNLTTNVSKGPGTASITIRKPNRPGIPTPSFPSQPQSTLAHSSAGPSQPSQPPPPQQQQSHNSSINGPPSAPSTVFPALHLTPLNDTFVPKQISLNPPGTKVKIGRQTNAKTIPNASNGYFDSKVLSRMHAEVWSEDGKVLIKDVKSSNGTFINGTRLSPEAAESDVFQLHSDDVVEFGIDIVSEDNKTIVHHKVAAKVYLVMNAEDAAISQREFQHWYRAASEAPVQRRGAKPVTQGSNGLSFEHVLSRLQGEIQKSRDTGNHLGDLTSTLGEVQDTLGGGAPPPLPNFPHPSRVPPYIPNGANKDVHAQSIAALQTQLNETQNSLAGHVGKIRDLEGLLAEHEVIKHEVGSLRKQMEDAQKDMESVLRSRSDAQGLRNGGSDGRESPVAALLEAQEDEDDAKSIASTDTVRINTAEQVAHARQNGILPLVNGIAGGVVGGALAGVAGDAVKDKEVDSARETQLQEQNAKLSARLEALSAELDEATKLGQSLRSQHAEASSTIRALEERIQGLEKAVEGRVAEVEGKVMQEAEQRWKGWREAFEESWKKERESWESEREKLTAVVRDWEERKKTSISSDEGTDDEDDPVDEVANGEKGITVTSSSGSGKSSSKGKRTRSSRRRRRSTASRVSVLASGRTEDGVASDSDETIGDSSTTGPVSGAWSGPQRGGLASGGGPAGYGHGGHGAGGTQTVPYASAGAVVLIGVAAAWALSVKLKE